MTECIVRKSYSFVIQERRVPMKIEYLKQLIKDNSNIVVITGPGLIVESGYSCLQTDEEQYEVEAKYKRSAGELYSAQFWATRTEQFFEFYKNEIVFDGEPCEAYYKLADLEKQGKIKGFVTKSIFGLEQKAGCRNVIELYGNIHRNRCPRCGKSFSLNYVMSSKKTVPICDVCGTAVRPDVVLYGEMMNNRLMTRAANLIAKADMVLLLGTNIFSYQIANFLQYYDGNKLVVVTPKESFGDEQANLVIRSKVCDVMRELF